MKDDGEVGNTGYNWGPGEGGKGEQKGDARRENESEIERDGDGGWKEGWGEGDVNGRRRWKNASTNSARRQPGNPRADHLSVGATSEDLLAAWLVGWQEAKKWLA